MAASSSRPSASPLPPKAVPVNTKTSVLDTVHGRILCIADIRGRISNLNELAAQAGAKAIIHTGDFGFFESNSLDRINDRTLRHLVMYSPLITQPQRNRMLAPDQPPQALRTALGNSTTPMLSEFPELLSGQIKLNVPVYTVWGACEDVSVLEKFRSGQYEIENLNVLDEATTRCLDVGGVKLRLLGLGGALVPHKMFDNGDGQATIAGGQGTMWTTALQIGELVDTAQRVFDPAETRLLITHASPGREGLLAQLSLVVKADLTISAGLHFRYASSYNEFSVQTDLEGFRNKLQGGRESFEKVWETVKGQVDAVLDDNQRMLLEKALSVVDRVPPPPSATGPGNANTGEEPAWKNCWNWNLCDAAYGSLVLDIREGRVSAELKSQGFNYAYRRSATPTTAATPVTATSALPSASATPAPSNVFNHASPKVNASTTGANTPTAASSTPVKDDPAKTNGAEKSKKKDKKDKKDKPKKEDTKPVAKPDGDAAKPGPVSPAKQGKSTPGPKSTATSSSKPGSPAPTQDEAIEPTSPAADSTGTRTPTTKTAPRNPWTLFMKNNPIPVTEAEIKDFFGDTKAGITHIKIPIFNHTKQQKGTAFVEFGDEEAMKEGLVKHGKTIGEAQPRVSIAEDRNMGGTMSRGGRGGRGGFAQRGLAAAGLGRQNSQRRENGDGDSHKDA